MTIFEVHLDKQVVADGKREHVASKVRALEGVTEAKFLFPEYHVPALRAALMVTVKDDMDVNDALKRLESIDGVENVKTPWIPKHQEWILTSRGRFPAP